MKKLIYWDGLSKIGNNRFVKSSYYWLLIIPIIVKILANVEPNLVLVIFEYEFKLDLGLPFKWQLMFLASLFFSISIILFNLFCPLIFKENKNFNSFLNQGFTEHKLSEYSNETNIDISSFTVTPMPTLKDILTPENKDKLNSWNEQKIKEYSEMFWHIYNISRELNFLSRVIIGLFFYSGLSIIAFIIIKNILYVFRSGFLF